MNKSCRQCLHFSQSCADFWKQGIVCGFYTPLVEDTDIEDVIESGRAEFRKQWFQYIEENDD